MSPHLLPISFRCQHSGIRIRQGAELPPALLPALLPPALLPLAANTQRSVFGKVCMTPARSRAPSRPSPALISSSTRRCQDLEKKKNKKKKRAAWHLQEVELQHVLAVPDVGGVGKAVHLVQSPQYPHQLAAHALPPGPRSLAVLPLHPGLDLLRPFPSSSYGNVRTPSTPTFYSSDVLLYNIYIYKVKEYMHISEIV